MPLLYLKDYFRLWKCNSKERKKNLSSHGAYIPVEMKETKASKYSSRGKRQ